MPKNQPTAWVGWVYFASAMLLLVGGMEVIAGLAALFRDDYYVVTQAGLVAFSYTTWGWIHLGIGVLLMAAGGAIATGQTWGRVFGIILAILSGLAHMAFLSAYPLWSLIAITVNVFVIYALTTHGAEVRD